MHALIAPLLMSLAQSPAASPAAGPPKVTPPAGPVVVLETSLGTIRMRLFKDKAPVTVDNFLKYVRDRHYDGTIFHRVIPGFMAQGGGVTADMSERPTRPPIKNEATNGVSNRRGTVAMARTDVPDSATAQFFINVKDNDFLNHQPGKGAAGAGYAVFGEVVEGMEVVDRIVTAKRDRSDRPLEAIVIKKATVAP
jgi:cyclophilin family peptidyl-prolyl cis-trans isomerase